MQTSALLHELMNPLKALKAKAAAGCSKEEFQDMLAMLAYSFQVAKSASTSRIFSRSSVTTSNSRTDLLYSGGLPA